MNDQLLENFKTRLTATEASFKVMHRAPSNIALVKYWGKYDPQLPANPSISFTLSRAFTETLVFFEPSMSPKINLKFEGKAKPSFIPKVQSFIDRIKDYCPYLSGYNLEIETSNSFPHSSGIASSASGMAALAMAICSLEANLSGDKVDLKKASFLARLGSGSAARSIEGPLMSWGLHKDILGSSDLFATPFFEAHPIFNAYQDAILLVHKGVKSVSSTVGHNLMNNHPFAEQRFAQANENLARLLRVLRTGDLDDFIEIVELEALSLHAMMFSSTPSYILMQPGTLSIIQRIRTFRKETGIPVCFTLDAGANVHVLYPLENKEIVVDLIDNELSAFCEDGQYLLDECGLGAK
ncbi:MAG: diphosphomevalonate/mevalonate 3,5-bisphosphate decarboxylase family protein [Flavobacteriaceae bacterium]|jgi:diphosphomevalonate decarboxylase